MKNSNHSTKMNKDKMEHQANYIKK